MTKLHLSQETIARITYVAQFSGTQDIRYYLNGVCLQNDSNGFFAVATDGHVLAYAKLGDKLGDDFEIILQNSTVKIIAACKDISGIDLEHNSATSDVSIRTQEGTQTLKALGGKYPDWRRVVPQDDTAQIDNGQPLGLKASNLALLEKAYKAFKKHDKSIGEVLTIKYYGQTRPVVFEPEVPDIKVLLMPCRR